MLSSKICTVGSQRPLSSSECKLVYQSDTLPFLVSEDQLPKHVVILLSGKCKHECMLLQYSGISVQAFYLSELLELYKA